MSELFDMPDAEINLIPVIPTIQESIPEIQIIIKPELTPELTPEPKPEIPTEEKTEEDTTIAHAKLMVKIARKLDQKKKYKLADSFTRILRTYHVQS